MNLGLKLSGEYNPIPLTKDNETSWIKYVSPGDDQGNVGACAFFTMAEWAEVKFGKSISNEERIRVYQEEFLGDAPDEGATFPEAFITARKSLWFPGMSRILRADMDDLRDQPLLAGVKVTDAFNVNAAGCMDHSAGDNVLGYHAMLVIATGQITAMGDDWWVYLKNWWKPSWGFRGMCVMRQDVFNDLCLEMWKIA